ncbi:uncharacterized protein LOC126675005 [Mercurialis annua]|uniref:uncharacterized protein LOC126675005 n=1 Tax=Mercurialis annua TaxID=3986 RepID=UPI00215F05EF|nr:uncharacterized protein LOC126675005 [Mercurialis annua]
MGDSTSRTHTVNTCHVCGDAGFLKKIVTCFQCETTQEHVYCMPVLLLTVPQIWICNACRSKEENNFQMSLNSDIVCSSTMQSIVTVELSENPGILLNFENETTVGSGKLNSISSQEAIEQLSSALKLENHSANRQGSSSGQSTSIIEPSTTAIGFKTPPSKFSKQTVKASPIVGLREYSLPPGNDVAESSLMTQQLACQIKDERTSLEYQEKYVVKEEPAAILLPAKRVKSPISTFRKTVKLSHSPVDCKSTAYSGHSLHIDAYSKTLCVQEDDKPKLLPKIEKYFPHQPAPKVTWCGSIEICFSVSHSELFDGFRAYVPGGVHSKAFEFLKKMPGVLRCTMFQSSSLGIFQDGYPKDRAVYFFPINFERSRQQYERLFLMLEMKDIVLISSLSDVQLLVFPSKRLKLNFHGLERFLCGLYRPIKHEQGVVPRALVKVEKQ